MRNRKLFESFCVRLGVGEAAGGTGRVLQVGLCRKKCWFGGKVWGPLVGDNCQEKEEMGLFRVGGFLKPHKAARAFVTESVRSS
jgi:hypothetical protein